MTLTLGEIALKAGSFILLLVGAIVLTKVITKWIENKKDK